MRNIPVRQEKFDLNKKIVSKIYTTTTPKYGETAIRFVSHDHCSNVIKNSRINMKTSQEEKIDKYEPSEPSSDIINNSKPYPFVEKDESFSVSSSILSLASFSDCDLIDILSFKFSRDVQIANETPPNEPFFCKFCNKSNFSTELEAIIHCLSCPLNQYRIFSQKNNNHYDVEQKTISSPEGESDDFNYLVNNDIIDHNKGSGETDSEALNNSNYASQDDNRKYVFISRCLPLNFKLRRVLKKFKRWRVKTFNKKINSSTQNSMTNQNSSSQSLNDSSCTEDSDSTALLDKDVTVSRCCIGDVQARGKLDSVCVKAIPPINAFRYLDNSCKPLQ
mmetsp:Transcript_6370/g.9251  ORF Transcript_6370/g.9251 Transcript_6370/m.9251 type:complete len:334 (+) Transcript_6370:82-1083(+)